MTRLDASRLRSKENYKHQIEIVNESEKVDYNETKGVKYYCKLSDLHYFHVIDNPTADIMHDICEGTIPFTLKLLFDKCINSKLLSSDDLNSMVQFFNYGFLDKKNKPSDINLKRRSLGQNASQSLCLFRNIPFILYKFREDPNLEQIWPCIVSLLRIVEIMFSSEITEYDLSTLNEIIHTLLEGIKKENIKFIPKLHFMLHYASKIRSNGPLVHMSMARYESKHKVFKDFCKTTSNFKNINKTLAVKHQELLCTSGFTYIDDIGKSSPVPLDDDLIFNHENLLVNTFGTEVSKVNQIKRLRVNNYQYRRNLLISHKSSLHQIQNISISANRYYLLCKQFDCVSFNSFLNSFEIVESSLYTLLDLSDLKNAKSYEINCIQSAYFVKAESLVLQNQLCLPV